MYILIRAAAPDDDDDKYQKNYWKAAARTSDKLLDELTFYYHPGSAAQIAQGSFLPQISLLNNVVKFTYHTGKAITGELAGNAEWTDKAHPMKYLLRSFPVAKPITDYAIPLLAPDLAKEMGVQISTNAGRNN
jgi:hypothetical protein